MSPESAVSSRLGTPVNTITGEKRYNCPFCITSGNDADTKQHLYVNFDKGVYFCFRCGSGGVVNALLRALHLPEAHEIPHTRDDVEALIRQLTVSLVVTSSEVPKLELPCPVAPVWSIPESRKYLSDRGLTEDDCTTYGLVCGSHNGVERIFFPVYRPNSHEMIYWVGRKYLWGDEQNKKIPKYSNPPGVKKHLLYGLDVATEQPGYPDRVFIVEGPLSAIRTDRKAVALLGKQCSEYQLELLVQNAFFEYVVCLDGDAAPEAFDLCERLVLRGCNVSYVPMPDGEDPASIPDFYEYAMQAKTPMTLDVLCDFRLGGFYGQRR